jgi:hypothetical protein
MSGTTTVLLSDVLNYINNVAANHATRVPRARSSWHGQSEEQVTFVLRRVAEELNTLYGPATRVALRQPSLRAAASTDTVPNQTYRNRATT